MSITKKSVPLTLIFSVIVALGLNVIIWSKIGSINPNRIMSVLGSQVIGQVKAETIYPLFSCPCCGQPLDPNNICCEQAAERIAFIDELSNAKKSKEEIILTYVKKYGLNSFIDKSQADEFKKKLAESAPAERPIISISPEVIDLGEVSQAKGGTNASFEIINTGKTDLMINKLDTSCGCTSAAIVSKGEEGPRFAMPGHGTQNPTGWKIVITPGESAQLKVYYDPDVHKDFRGAAIREIYIYSNDPIDFEKKVTIELNQVD